MNDLGAYSNRGWEFGVTGASRSLTGERGGEGKGTEGERNGNFMGENLRTDADGVKRVMS